MRVLKLLILLCVVSLLASSQAMARCPNSLPMIQGQVGGNFWTSPGKQYTAWFWVPGQGNNLLNTAAGDVEAGIDSGLLGGPVSRAWLKDPFGDGRTRTVENDWFNGGVDGCGDLNGNNLAEPNEIVAVLIVDDRSEEYAVISVGGGGGTLPIPGWDLGRVNNGQADAKGRPGSGVPLSPVPRPRFGSARPAGSGQVEVEVQLPDRREIPTYDDVGGARPMVQGFHLIQDERLLAEVAGVGGSRKLTLSPGKVLTLRTIFGYPGDKGFYVDGDARVPNVGEAPDEDDRPGRGQDDDRPGDDAPGRRGTPSGVPVGTPSGEGDADAAADQDTDEDEIADDDDNCPRVANAEQEDMDEDGIGDICDSCPFDANGDQEDADGDGQGDVCDACPEDPENIDTDGDGVCDNTDNCRDIPNLDQGDADGDGPGDFCDDSYDPFVVEIVAEEKGVAAGKGVTVHLSVFNRSTSRQKMSVNVAWEDAKQGKAAWAADPECLSKVPLEVELASEDTFTRECRWTVPAGAAKGRGTLRLDVQHAEQEDVKASAEAKLNVQ